MSKSILITRPNHDVCTNYLYFWTSLVVKLSIQKNFQLFDLKGKKANKKNFDSYINKKHPSFIFLNGHGSETCITGYNNEILISLNKNILLMADKIIYARSCSAGKKLARVLVNKGALVFIGYKKEFYLPFLINKITKPLEDEVAKLFIEPSNLIPISIIKGNTIEFSFNKSQKAMRKNLFFMLSSRANYDQRSSAPYLYSNLKNQIAIGNIKEKLS